MGPDTPTKILDSADLGAGNPVPKPKPTRKQIGEMRSLYMTVRHDTVVACGHKLEAGHLPKHSNCEDCWTALFETNKEALPGLHNLLNTQGRQAVERLYGRKFTEAFGRYLRTMLLTLHTPQAQPEVGLEVPRLEEL